MGFEIIRIIILLILLMIGVFIGRIIPHINRVSKSVLRIALFVIWLLFSLTPFEKWIYTFPTPSAAFSYNHNEPISNVIEGDRTALVLADDSLVDIISKKSGGWGVSAAFETKLINYSESQEPIINIIKHRFTNECYLQLWFHQNGEHSILDSKGSEFLKTDESFYGTTIYGYIGIPDASYELIIDGVSYYLFDDQ